MIQTRILIVLAGVLLAAQATAKVPDPAAIHRRVLELDSHADVLLPGSPQRAFLPDGSSRDDIRHLLQGGIDAVVLAVAVGPGPRDAAGVAAARQEADRKLAFIKALVADNPQSAELALSADDVERIHRAGKVAILVGFQNARSLGSDLSQINVFYNQGVRIFGFNHIGHNAFSDSSRPGDGPVSENGGLSPLGRQAVARLNDLGVLIDVSQLSKAALLQTLALTRAPVAATHSSARSLVENTRNLSDEELDAIKANGGVVQVTPFTNYVHKASEESLRKLAELRVRFGLAAQAGNPFEGVEALPKDQQAAFAVELAKTVERGSLVEFVDHIDYIAKRIGWQHVGIGSDFNHGGGVIGFDSEADAPNVTAELVRRGYSEDQIAAIWGGNFLRVLRAAEAARAK